MLILEKNTLIGAPTKDSPLVGPPGGASGEFIIIQIMDDTILKEMITRLKQSKYYFVSVDFTPDASHVDQLTSILRY